jgi:hypothetical protein
MAGRGPVEGRDEVLGQKSVEGSLQGPFSLFLGNTALHEWMGFVLPTDFFGEV